ncbi:hypothetical protein UVI_02037500 [Ustilaginoidea virens]|uniref:alpha-1,2-Mannosidase n=1 Tax=Ustilaginoidea virens TaxID=1159556 RepID=A0A1B5KTG8_USTVR|nr:hypothetical protein UVI_02037500 [Ustilaginoidea virens]
MVLPRRMSRLVALTAIALVVLLLVRLMPGDVVPSPLPPTADQREAANGPKAQEPASSGEGTFSSSSSSSSSSSLSSSSSPSKSKSKSKFDWSKAKLFYPPASIKPLPTGTPRPMGRVQASPDAFVQTPETKRRQAAVRNVFRKSYNAYRTHAWMKDELMPVTAGFRNPFGAWAATLVDALDTLWIMDLRDEFREAARAVAGIDWSVTPDGAANLFETTIRHLGGLLSAHDLSGDKALLAKAVELGEMLYHGFDTPNNLPGFWLNYDEARTGALRAGTNDPSASPASLCVEFTRLSQLTGDSKYYDATDRVTRFLQRTQNSTRLPGMWPIALDFRNEAAGADARFTLGALADSLYEYLPKMHALTGGLDPTYEQLYRGAADVAARNLLFRPMVPDGRDVLFSGDWVAGSGGSGGSSGSSTGETGHVVPESQHLTCFVGGMFGLAGRLFAIDEHVALGERLARGCAWAYAAFPTGIMPEIFRLIPCADAGHCPWDESAWQRDGDRSLPRGFAGARDPRYQLRPEAIESLFVMYRITGRQELQDMAWDMFRAIVNATATEIAYSTISNVNAKGETEKTDSMEVETLKYFYLIFSPPDLISLDEYVLNTEAHPLKRPAVYQHERAKAPP